MGVSAGIPGAVVGAAVGEVGEAGAGAPWNPARNFESASPSSTAIGQDLEALRTMGLMGTPAEIVERLGVYAEMGVSRVYLQVLDLADLAHIELLAAEVLPRV